MTIKEKIVFGLYCAVAVATVAQATVEITRTMRSDRQMKKIYKEAEKAQKKD